MKLCYLADAASIHTRRWCEHFIRNGHEVHVISFRKGEIPGARIHLLDAGTISSSGGNWKVLLKYRQVKKMLREIKPDILHAMYATSYGSVGALTGFHPFVVTGLGSDILISPKQSKLYRKLLKYVCKRADWITVFAPFMITALDEMNIRYRKADTILLGIDDSVFNRSGRNKPHEKFVITGTRNFEPVYNLGLFIDAIAIVKDKIPAMEVNMTGDGSLRKTIEEHAEQKGVHGLIHFHGRIPQPQIASLLNKTDVFISTSLSDGNNISLNEAMACGAFPIVTDIPANRLWIEDGKNGYLVPTDDAQKLADKILYVYQHFEAMSQNAMLINEKIISEKASYAVNMKKVEEEYRKLAGKI